MKDLMRRSESLPNVSFHPWYRRKWGRQEEPGNFPFRSLSFPKESVRTGNEGKKSKTKKKQKSRMEAQSQDFPPLTRVSAGTERRGPNRYG